VDGGRADQPALIYDSPVTNAKKVFTYRELRDAVALFAGALRAQGVEKGDRVIVYMPMVPEAVVAMLACARIGAIHSVVFGGFAAKALATRINDARPRVMVSASCGIEGSKVVHYKPLLDEAIELAGHKPEHCIILQRPQAQAALRAGRDLDWAEAVAAAQPVGTPDAGAFWRVISEYEVKVMFTAPTAFRAIKREDPEGEVSGAVRPERLQGALPGRGAV